MSIQGNDPGPWDPGNPSVPREVGQGSDSQHPMDPINELRSEGLIFAFTTAHQSEIVAAV